MEIFYLFFYINHNFCIPRIPHQLPIVVYSGCKRMWNKNKKLNLQIKKKPVSNSGNNIFSVKNKY